MTGQTPQLISVSGIDGSGKTTIIDALSSDLLAKGRKVRVVWLRYNHYLTKIILGFGRLFGYTVFEQYPECRVSYHEFYRSKLLSHAFIWLTWIDTALTTLILVRIPSLFSPRLTICDRWIPDILIDLEIDTRLDLRAGHAYARLFWTLVPKSAALMVVNRDYEDIVAARPEHRYDRNLRQRYELYLALAQERSLRLIDNTGDLNDTIRTTIEWLTATRD